MSPLSLRERGLGVRATPPVSRTLKSPRCCDRVRGTVRRAMQYPHPSPLPEGEGGLPELFRYQAKASGRNRVAVSPPVLRRTGADMEIPQSLLGGGK